MNFKPLSGYILIKRYEPETQTESGLWIPPIAQQKTDKALVCAVSEKRKSKEEINIGDSIIFHANAGQDIVINGEKYELIHEDSILATLEFKPSNKGGKNAGP